MFVNVQKLKQVIKEKKTTQDAVAHACGIDRTTFLRRLDTNSLRVSDMHAIVAFLDLSMEEAIEIFLAQKVAK